MGSTRLSKVGIDGNRDIHPTAEAVGGSDIHRKHTLSSMLGKKIHDGHPRMMKCIGHHLLPFAVYGESKREPALSERLEVTQACHMQQHADLLPCDERR